MSVRSGSTRTSRALVNRFRNFRSDRFTAIDLKQLTSGVPSVSITLDGRLAVSVGNDMTLRIWDLDRGECHYVLKRETPAAGLWISGDGRHAVSGGGSADSMSGTLKAVSPCEA